MKYAEWIAGVPCEITNDPIWKMQVYRLALFAADIGRRDAVSLIKKPVARGVADQLFRSLCSISANLTEGYSRSKAPDRARFFEIALGSARECRDWYFKARQDLPADVVAHRMAMLSQIIGMLTLLIPQQRRQGLREEPASYEASTWPEDKDVPAP